jgi:hypothetical protein
VNSLVVVALFVRQLHAREKSHHSHVCNGVSFPTLFLKKSSTENTQKHLWSPQYQTPNAYGTALANVMTSSITTTTSSLKDSPSSLESAYTKALLRSLQFQGVQFLRYLTLDPYNNVRAKAVPITHLMKRKQEHQPLLSLHKQCSIAEVCHGGLASYADHMVEGTGMSPRYMISTRAM